MVGRKLNFTSFFFNKFTKTSSLSSSSSFSSSYSTSPWPWLPSCSHPKTLSFRDPNDVLIKTVNSVYFDSPEESLTIFSSELDLVGPLQRSDGRFFFDHSETSSSIMTGRSLTSAAAITVDGVDEASSPSPPRPGPSRTFDESEAVTVDSDDPYEDFRSSMADMVEAHELKDWESLKELLVIYLKLNGKTNHGFILGAFVDLLVLLSSSSSASSPSPSSSTSSTETAGSSESNSSTTSIATLLSSAIEEIEEVGLK